MALFWANRSVFGGHEANLMRERESQGRQKKKSNQHALTNSFNLARKKKKERVSARGANKNMSFYYS